jgi:hypothetical protein
MTQSRHPVQLRRLLDLAAAGFDPGAVDAIMGDSASIVPIRPMNPVCV